MRRTLEMPHRKYNGIGRCIFCLDAGSPLTDEHIVPRALSGIGEMFIEDGSCGKCNGGMNERFENPALQHDLAAIRAMLELKRRKKNHPISMPEIRLKDQDGNWVDADLEPSQYPPTVSMLCYPPAGLLVGEKRTGDITALGVATINLGRGVDWKGAEIRTSHVSGAVPLLVAKAAYSYAVAERGLGAFEGGEIRALLKGERDDIYNFAGRAPAVENHLRQHFHHLLFRRRGKWLTVIVHLFASFEAPAWEVVVGHAHD